MVDRWNGCRKIVWISEKQVKYFGKSLWHRNIFRIFVDIKNSLLVN
nr:MAG TPA: hypothetical protein [Caudoviricetes sp.]DAM60471.1 MAG TPA: hypothetical protein [Caudoviricetes sp.]DAN11829.1 MAG TPA: hypothetical protein [Caudoviricetes sp.]